MPQAAVAGILHPGCLLLLKSGAFPLVLPPNPRPLPQFPGDHAPGCPGTVHVAAVGSKQCAKDKRLKLRCSGSELS